MENENKIVNSEKTMEIIKKIEGIFNKAKLTMIDREYVTLQLQKAIEIYYKDVGERAIMNLNLKNFMGKIKDIQVKKDL